jgi:hypothetical protein
MHACLVGAAYNLTLVQQPAGAWSCRWLAIFTFLRGLGKISQKGPVLMKNSGSVRGLKAAEGCRCAVFFNGIDPYVTW